uniref:pyridoxal 5'-phosphate synthase n=1 Tax=Arundo donax TaxID=35708 RepID=A0A0A9F5J4_ARUDO
MAGGGAAASALSSPWRALLQRSLDANAHLRHSTYFQLATVGAGGRPANRTVVFRGFQEHCDKIQINTDARSNKIGEIKSCPFGEICWYFTDSWEQFRISGRIDVIDGSSADPVKLQYREKAWFASSVKSRLQYLGPQPGIPVVDDEHVKDVHLDPSAGPVDAFCLLVVDPDKVDYLNLKSNQRLMFIRSQKEDGSGDWMAEKVSP